MTDEQWWNEVEKEAAALLPMLSKKDLHSPLSGAPIGKAVVAVHRAGLTKLYREFESRILALEKKNESLGEWP